MRGDIYDKIILEKKKGGNMTLVDIVKYSGTLEEFIWKYPRDDLGTWTQFIVTET